MTLWSNSCQNICSACIIMYVSESQSLQSPWTLCQSWAYCQVSWSRLRELSYRSVRQCMPSQWQRLAVCCHRQLIMFFITAIITSIFRSDLNLYITFFWHFLFVAVLILLCMKCVNAVCLMNEWVSNIQSKIQFVQHGITTP